MKHEMLHQTAADRFSFLVREGGRRTIVTGELLTSVEIFQEETALQTQTRCMTAARILRMGISFGKVYSHLGVTWLPTTLERRK